MSSAAFNALCRYGMGNFAVADAQLLVAMPDGCWAGTHSDGPLQRKVTAVVKGYTEAALALARATEEEAGGPASGGDGELTPRIIDALITDLHRFALDPMPQLPPGAPAPHRIAPGQLGAGRVVRVAGGGVYDIRTGMALAPLEARSLYQRYTEAPGLTLLTEMGSPPPPLARFMNHTGIKIWDRLAMLLGQPPAKSMDVWINPGVNAGKSLVPFLCESALPGVYQTGDARHMFSGQGQRFSVLKVALTDAKVVVLDEFDKAGDDKPLTAAVLNPLTNPILSVEVKGVQARMVARSANLMCVGNGMPDMVPGAGLAHRMRWMLESNLPAFPDNDGVALYEPSVETLDWLGNWLVRRATELYRADGDPTDTPERRDDAARLLAGSYDPGTAALYDVFERRNADSYVPVSEVRNVLTDAGDDSGANPKAHILPIVRRVSPGATRVKRRLTPGGAQEWVFTHMGWK